ncbi:hypothetical protein PV726_49650 [Streptomyces europaeiscabiei]|uniref:hypothetical protein n=1 Tax=Streptomyces europaeiscabiei TaxID=146819 RepID=UPI0029A44C2D|nr:hypothetical protein [Streptomyces europaeiscabiei]MDX3698069.1 hypothetical protein [Streptomyces europaeiscabiei]
MPASFAAVVISTALGWAFTGDGSDGSGDPRLPLLILGAGVMAASIGLSGQDLALDRTAAIRWLPRRVAHVLLAGVIVGAVLMTAQATSGWTVSVELVVRDCGGLMGLAALGAVVLGGPYAWSLPFGWRCHVG